MNKQDILHKIEDLKKQINEIEDLKKQIKEIEKRQRSDGFLSLLWSVLLDEKSKIILTGHEEWQFTERYLVKDISSEYREEIAKFLNTLIKKENDKRRELNND